MDRHRELPGKGEGTLGLNLNDNDTITDAATNKLGGTGTGTAGSGGAGNGSFTGQVYTIDHTAPSVTVNQAAGQADPTNESPINFKAVFSEVVNDFDATDVTTGGTASGTLLAVVTDTGDHKTYNIAISGMTSDGTVTATVAVDKAHDAAGNGNTASTSTDGSVTFDTTTSTSIQSSQNPSTFGESVDFTASVTALGTPVTSGTVTFIEGGTCTSPVTTLAGPTAVNGSGQATFGKSSLTTGSHTITACYSGATNRKPSNGGIVQTVNPRATTTSVNSSLNPSTFGESVTFTATVAGTGAGAGDPGTQGTVQFKMTAIPSARP